MDSEDLLVQWPVVFAHLRPPRRFANHPTSPDIRTSRRVGSAARSTRQQVSGREGDLPPEEDAVILLADGGVVPVSRRVVHAMWPIHLSMELDWSR